MTAFDALMPGGSGTSQAGAGAGRGGASGDWRQAVEHAQTRSWLQGRNTESGVGPQPDQGGLRNPGKASSDAAPATSHEQTIASQHPRESGRQDSVLVRAGAGDAPNARQVPARTSASVATPGFLSAPSAPTRQSPTRYAEQAVVLTQLASTYGVRPRKQSVHIESGEQGIFVWVRDASLNSQQANHLAAAIAANLGDGAQRLAALYLNGQSLALDRNELSRSLSSPFLPE